MVYLVLLLNLLFLNSAHADMRNYHLCPGVSSVYISDPYNSRGIVVNYDPVRKYFVFLRCGDRDNLKPGSKTQNLNCHVYQEGSEQSLCQREIKHSKVSRVLSEVIDAGVSFATSGGMSTVQKAKRVISVARDLRMNPRCLGMSYLQAFAQGNGTSAMMQEYYSAQAELGPMTRLTRLTTMTAKAKQGYIFSQLDTMLSAGGRTDSQGKKSVMLKGPSYFTARRSRTEDQLIVDSPSPVPFCNRMKQGPSAPEPEKSEEPESSQEEVPAVALM